ncbi:MAG TPA: hypothetical protein DCE80_18365, partial [Ignavibacteriales bacterium]|nr:hypothetical protein [Ignavibacteriales bacterium]
MKKFVYLMLMVTSFGVAQTQVSIGTFYSNTNFDGVLTPAYINVTTPGNYTVEYTGLGGLGFSSHRFDRNIRTYIPAYDGSYEVVATNMKIKPNPWVPNDYGPIRKFFQPYPCDYYTEEITGIFLPNYYDICNNINSVLFCYWCAETLNDILQAAKVWYTVTQGAKLGLGTPTSMNIGTVRGLWYFQGSIRIQNVATQGYPIMGLNLTTIHQYYDLNLSTPTVLDNLYYPEGDLWPGNETTVNFGGVAEKFAGPFVHTVVVGTKYYTVNNYAGTKTFFIYGNVKVPDFCQQETASKNLPPEENLFDSAFVSSSLYDSSSVGSKDQKISLKEKMKFAYEVLKLSDSVKIKDVCKQIITKFPNTELGLSYFALDILWQLTEVEDKNEKMNIKEFIEFLQILNNRSEFNVHAWAGLILASYLESSQKINTLENVFKKFTDTRFGVMAKYLQFMYYAVDRNDSVTGRDILNIMEDYYPNSNYTYHAHIILGDSGYTTQGYNILLSK